jgi:hypothetical protein
MKVLAASKNRTTDHDSLNFSTPSSSNQWCLWQPHSAYSRFTRTVLARDFADLVRPLQSTAPSPLLIFFPDRPLDIHPQLLLQRLEFHYQRLLVRRSTADRCQFFIQSHCRSADAIGRSRRHRVCSLMNPIRYCPAAVSGSVRTSSDTACDSPASGTAAGGHKCQSKQNEKLSVQSTRAK